jgi:metal-responsive CopG/Arc/MetJ family transcriptional regulator
VNHHDIKRPKPKVLIQAKIPDWMLEEIDALAKREDTSRSAIVQAALTALLHDLNPPKRKR